MQNMHAAMLLCLLPPALPWCVVSRRSPVHNIYISLRRAADLITELCFMNHPNNQQNQMLVLGRNTGVTLL